MASMLEDLNAMLRAGGTVAGQKVYAGTVPDSLPVPFIIHHRIHARSENVLDGNVGLINTQVQIDSYSQTYAEAQQLAEQVDALMGAWVTKNVSIGAVDMYEPEVRFHRVSADYSIWHT